MYQAMFTKDDKCFLCPHDCLILEGKFGKCGVRTNHHGIIYSSVYGQCVSISVDPIEKKPLYHFHPGENILSFGTKGCNLFCKGCQNYSISQSKIIDENNSCEYTPKEIIAIALQKQIKMIAYTYTEPTIFYEYMFDTAVLAKKAGIKNIMVSNGYINKEPLIKICEFIDAVNIDLKFFDNEKYEKYCGGKLIYVLDNLKLLKSKGVWIEITNLVIPGLSDDPKMFENMCKWISSELSENVPIHISRFFPYYKLEDVIPTPIDILEKFSKIAKKYLNYVYVGNTLNESNTLCPKCNHLLIKRKGYEITTNLSGGKCPKCQENIQGKFKN